MKRILVVVAAVVLVLILVGFVLPSTYAVERDGVVPAPRAQVFARVADLRTWPEWTTWSRAADPGCVWTFSEPTPGGVPTVMHWKGDVHREGRLVLTNLGAPDRLDYRLVFISDESEVVSSGAILFDDVPEGTRVVWSLEGDLGWNPGMRWLGLFMDSMLGRSFEGGLDGLAASFDVPEDGGAGS